jgi:hypothetical protein
MTARFLQVRRESAAARFGGKVRHLTRRGILCSLAVGRVKLVRQP